MKLTVRDWDAEILAAEESNWEAMLQNRSLRHSRVALALNQVMRDPLSVSGTAVADLLQFKENPDAWFIVEDSTEGVTPTNQVLAGHR